MMKKTMGLMVGLLALNGVCFAVLAQEKSETNLIGNGSFEEGMKYWGGRPPARITVDDSTSTDGKYSMKLDGTTTETAIWMAAGQSLTSGRIEPSTEYILKGDIRRTTAKGSVGIVVLEKPKEKTNNDWTYHWCGKNPEKGLNAWEHFELKFKTNPKVDDAMVQLYNIQSGGIVWFDNLRLMEVPAQ